MNRNDDPELWDLLGKQRLADPGKMFSRDVLRRIRTGNIVQERRSSWWSRLLPSRQSPLSWIPSASLAAACVVLAAIQIIPGADPNIGSLETRIASATHSAATDDLWSASAIEVIPGDETELMAKVDSPESLSDDQILALLVY